MAYFSPHITGYRISSPAVELGRFIPWDVIDHRRWETARISEASTDSTWYDLGGTIETIVASGLAPRVGAALQENLCCHTKEWFHCSFVIFNSRNQVVVKLQLGVSLVWFPVSYRCCPCFPPIDLFRLQHAWYKKCDGLPSAVFFWCTVLCVFSLWLFFIFKWRQCNYIYILDYVHIRSVMWYFNLLYIYIYTYDTLMLLHNIFLRVCQWSHNDSHNDDKGQHTTTMPAAETGIK